MKRAVMLPLFLLILLILCAGCSGEAKEPAPGWPERLTGEYDAAVTFTFQGEAPEAAGVDSQTGRMTALFPTDGGFLVLGWRRVMSGEAEILESFLEGTGTEAGVWEPDGDAPGALESYVRLGRGWYCLSAACEGLGEARLLNLVDGAVEAAAGEDAARPRAGSDRWLEALPWEEEWTCLLLGNWELDPAAGKEALRSLLYSYDWELIDPEAEEGEFIPSLGDSLVPLVRQTSIYLDETFTRETVPIRFHLRAGGDLYWNGTLRRPLGEGAGEALLAAWNALRETGVNTLAPPRLSLVSGEARIDAITYGSYSWVHTTRIGGGMGAESDAANYWEIDWPDLDAPILSAEGPVCLDFAMREPDRLSLYVFEGPASDPLAVTEGRFTPLAGFHTYILYCGWSLSPGETGGGGSGCYILLIDGGEAPAPSPGTPTP